MMGLPVLDSHCSEFGGRRLTFGLVVLLLVGVVFFPIFSYHGSCVIP